MIPPYNWRPFSDYILVEDNEGNPISNPICRIIRRSPIKAMAKDAICIRMMSNEKVANSERAARKFPPANFASPCFRLPFLNELRFNALASKRSSPKWTSSNRRVEEMPTLSLPSMSVFQSAKSLQSELLKARISQVAKEMEKLVEKVCSSFWSSKILYI